MKKIVVILLFSVGWTICGAQVTVPKTPTTTSLKDFVKPPAIGDISKTTKGIVDKLMGGLSLPDTKKSPLTDAVSGFLKKKEGILGLANSNPAEYLSKFNPLQTDLFGKLKDIMGSETFTKFLGMKPSGSNATGNILSNLFF